jgi:hypothetical protein
MDELREAWRNLHGYFREMGGSRVEVVFDAILWERYERAMNRAMEEWVATRLPHKHMSGIVHAPRNPEIRLYNPDTSGRTVS